MYKILFNKLLDDCGASKMLQVIMGACFCACAGGIFLMVFIPNKPREIKENE